MSILLIICTLVAVGGGLTTAVTFVFAQKRTTEQSNLRFNEVVNGHVNEVMQRMESYGDLLYATKGLFAASQVDAVTWNRFIQAQSALYRYPGLKAIAYAQAVPHQDLKAYEQKLRASIRPEAELKEHVILSYHEDISSTVGAKRDIIGYDMAATEVRSNALERAKNSGMIAATEPIDLASTDKKGFLLILPLKDRVGTIGQPKVFGYSIASFDIDEFIDRTIGERLEQYQSSIRITDVTDPDPVTLYEKKFNTWNRTITREVPIIIADRTWQISLTVPSGNLLTTPERAAPFVVLVVGIGFLIIFCISIYALRVRHRLSCTIKP